MKNQLLALSVVSVALLAACGKKAEETAPAPTPAPAAPAAPAETPAMGGMSTAK